MITSIIKNLSILGIIIGIMACSPGVEETALEEQDPQQEAMPRQPEAVDSSDITDEELDQFAGAMEAIQPITNQAQAQMAETIDDSDISMERYQEVAMAQQQGREVDLNPEEQQQLQEIEDQMQALQAEIQEEQIKGIEETGMTVQRFQQISAALQQDPELQQRFSEVSGQIIGSPPQDQE